MVNSEKVGGVGMPVVTPVMNHERALRRLIVTVTVLPLVSNLIGTRRSIRRVVSSNVSPPMVSDRRFSRSTCGPTVMLTAYRRSRIVRMS